MLGQDDIAEFIATRPDVAAGILISGLLAAAVVLPPAFKALGAALGLVFKVGIKAVLA